VRDVETTVLTLNLTAGSYLLQASMMLDNGGKNINLVCTLYDGATVLSVAPMRADANRDTTVSLTRTRVLAAPATITMRCLVDDTESVASYRTLAAVRVGSVTTQ
jgi:hypothetical protein